MPPVSNVNSTVPKLFLPSRREALLLALAGALSLGLALLLRYVIIQNTPLGIGCDAGEATLTCKVRLAVILMFTFSVFGMAALAAAAIQLWRPHIVTFGIGLVLALIGLVLYNTGASALAFTLLLLSLARPLPGAR
jgi:hypothetical protein